MPNTGSTCALVLFQGDIDGFSWSVSVQGKAQSEAEWPGPLQGLQRRHGR